MRVIKGCVTVIGIIGILAITTLIVGYFLFSLTPPIKAEMLPFAASKEAAQSFDQKIETLKAEIEAAVDAKEEKEVTLVITEQEINNKMLDLKAEGELPLEDILINFDNKGYLLVYSELATPGVDAKTGVKGKMKVVEGNLKIVVEDFDLGKLPLPQSIKGGVESLLNILVSPRLADLPMEITAIKVSNDQLAITGLTKIAD